MGINGLGRPKNKSKNMGFENFQLNPEEVAKAEKMMTRTETELSKDRENRLRASQEAGKEAKLSKSEGINMLGGTTTEIEGTVDGHKIWIQRVLDKKQNAIQKFLSIGPIGSKSEFIKAERFRAIVDGQEFNDGDSEKLWNKYNPMSMTAVTEKVRTKIKEEITAENKMETLKKLGL